MFSADDQLFHSFVIAVIPFIYQPLHEGGIAQLHAKYYKKGNYEVDISALLHQSSVDSSQESTGTPPLACWSA